MTMATMDLPLDTAAGVAKIWEQILQVSPIGDNDDFFDLGGDSVLAVKMLLEIERQFGKELPFSVLAEGVTVAALTKQLGGPVDAKAQSSSVLVPLRAEGSKPPLYLVHGVGLPTLRNNFVGFLDPAQPFYIFQHRGLDGRTATNPTIEAMAADYIAAMREVQPRGPYFLGGFCAGAYVALEMAGQLAAQGEAVPVLFLVDPPTILHASKGSWSVPWYAMRLGGYIWRQLTRVMNRKLGNRNKAVTGEKMRLRARSLASSGFEDETRLADVLRAQRSFIWALRKYRPRPYRGTIHLFCQEDQAHRKPGKQRRFWSRAYDGVRFQPVGKTHSEIYSTHLDELAGHIQRGLDSYAG